VIKPRAFEALFYGIVVGADPDMYPLWHSSQVEAGLNIANYDNNEVDKLLEDARKSSDNEVRREKYLQFQEYLAEDLPAIFLYSPTYTYLQSKKLKGFDVVTIITPQDRLANITDWYLKTGKKLVW
jgi:peptide/nickel transport system substrate-binding protein